MSGWRLQRLCDRVLDADPRGGASIACVPCGLAAESSASSSSVPEHAIVIFGGANREQAHYNDLILSKRGAVQRNNAESGISGRSSDDVQGCPPLLFAKELASGDTPPPRSGHAVAALPTAPYMLLHGGIDFAEEVCYNDLYLLNISTLDWRYVGEAGEEIPARNSHSLGVLPCAAGGCYLVLYGGASPECGVFGDTYYAHVSSYGDFDEEKFFVTWVLLPETEEGPGQREMHSTCVVGGELLIIGGRREDGSVLSDAWVLTASTADGAAAPLSWRRRRDLELPNPLCSHGSAAMAGRVCVYGGFSGAGIGNDLLTAELDSSPAVAASVFPSPSRWVAQECLHNVGGRLGFSMCAMPHTMLAGGCEGVVLFGGVDVAEDFGDVSAILLYP